MGEATSSHGHKSAAEVLVTATVDAFSSKVNMWLKVAQMFGIPIVILAAVGFAVAQVYSDAKPLAIKFIDKQIVLMDVLVIHAQQADVLSSQRNITISEMADDQRKTAEATKLTNVHLESLASSQSDIKELLAETLKLQQRRENRGGPAN